MSVTAIIVAAGRGSRAGFSVNKLLVPTAKGIPIVNTVRAFDRPDVVSIVVSANPDDIPALQPLLAQIPRVRIIEGGSTRTQSVKNALCVCNSEIVLIHDGARPFVSQKIISDCIHSVRTHGSGICALPVTDTTVYAEQSTVLSVPDRSSLYKVQTPQGFLLHEIAAAYGAILENESFTDDSSVFLAKIRPPHLFSGEESNVKLTYREDFNRMNFPFRTGFGTDTHAFSPPESNAHITLGGVKIPHTQHLIAHSDGDVLAHAVCDALLSSVGLADIGTHFPDSDPTYKNADSLTLLQTVVDLVFQQGFAPVNVSCAISAQKPKLAPFVPTMRENIARVLKIDPSCVGISAGTTERLGFVGRCEGITVQASVLVAQI